MKVQSLPFFTKSVAMAKSLEISKKRSRSIICTQNAFIRWKDCKNGSADPEIICLWEIIKNTKKKKKKKKINASKIYSPVGNLAERAKKLTYLSWGGHAPWCPIAGDATDCFIQFLAVFPPYLKLKMYSIPDHSVSLIPLLWISGPANTVCLWCFCAQSTDDQLSHWSLTHCYCIIALSQCDADM